MRAIKQQFNTMLLSIVLILSANINAYSQNKSNKIKVYKAWVKLIDGSTNKGVLYAADSLGIKLSDGITLDNLKSISPEKIQEVRIRKKGSVGKGVWIGALSGAALGAIIGFASGDDEGSFFAFTKEEKAMGSAVALGTLGAGFGALGGTAKKKVIINGQNNVYLQKLEFIQSYSLNQRVN